MLKSSAGDGQIRESVPSAAAFQIVAKHPRLFQIGAVRGGLEGRQAIMEPDQILRNGGA